VLEELMLEAGAAKGRDLRLEVRRIRSGAFGDRPGDVVWLDLMAPHRHIDVDVTVTSARTNTNVPRIGAHLPLPSSLALESQHGKLDADLRIYALPGTPSVQSIHDYYPFAMENGGRLAPMAAEVVDRLAFWWLFVASLAWVLLTLSACALTLMSVYKISFVRRTTYVHFRRFGGMCDVNSCNVFLMLFMALWVPLSATLFRRAVLTLWHAFLLVGLRFFLVFSFCLVAPTAFSCKKLVMFFII
jgi:hypothetical protein